MDISSRASQKGKPESEEIELASRHQIRDTDPKPTPARVCHDRHSDAESNAASKSSKRATLASGGVLESEL